MRAFAKLVHALDSTNKTNQKLEAVHHFFREAEDKDKLWFLALFSGRRPKRAVSTTLLREWAKEITKIPEWLFLESYSSVGDLGETISLLLPDPKGYMEYSLSEWMDKINQLPFYDEYEKKQFILKVWGSLPHQERFIFNKLLGGSFRLGLSTKGLVNAISSYYNLDASIVSHSIMGEWTVQNSNFEELVHGEYVDSNLSKPYPFCLAYPIENIEETLSDLSKWQIEYKWDGIRGQVIKRNDEIFIWSRGEELITDQFPEIVNEVRKWEGDFVLDGEILAIANGEILNFTALQKRLNRKVLSKKILEEVPVGMYVYDILEHNNKDLRNESMSYRRKMLESYFVNKQLISIKLSTIVKSESLVELSYIRERAREINSEGLMLKHKDSVYHVGRKKGDWWKWKIAPLTIDAVLIYAQKGSGRRSSQYTDYTFAVRDNENLVTIAKAYSGLTDKEIQEVSRFVNKNAVEKFGPVRTVKPELVFEIAFEGIGWSTRHKAGVALRFPRILRWRKDKTVAEIDDLESVKKLIH
ncbi:ATP-dependent DNA ligase [Sphingobacterium bovistauri]|uniref:DNA ligase (ATP) n=1 Tax=Sphingobacterium bovistauri TaxID=2781959 RepID=A0ABS7Z2K5_9SPHI|nr:ATP-dependent DNA ligase [Sphingobacterium bovistauri]MCA5003686.1 ATP-dependent DNA ligase [Sphingobacterium bovistauri]